MGVEDFLISAIPLVKDISLTTILVIVSYLLFKQWTNCQKENRDAIIEITKNNERTANILQSIEEKIVQHSKDLSIIKNTLLRSKKKDNDVK